MTVNDAALPEDSAAGGKGCKGNKTCGKSFRGRRGPANKKMLHLCFQDYSVQKRLEDRKRSVVCAPLSYVTPGLCVQQGMALCYCRLCRLWSQHTLLVPLFRVLVCPAVSHVGAIPSLGTLVTTLCSFNLTICCWRWWVGTKVGYPTPNQDRRHLSPVSNSATNILFSFCFLLLFTTCVYSVCKR